MHPFEYNFERGQLQLQHSRLLFTDRSNETKDIPLKTLYPKVYSILSKGNNPTNVKWGEESTKGENAYLYFLGPEDLNFDISFLELLYKVPEQRSGGWYDVLRYHKIPAEFSKDGQEHLANNKKEFFQGKDSNCKEQEHYKEENYRLCCKENLLCSYSYL